VLVGGLDTDTLQSGSVAGAGAILCVSCGLQLSLEPNEQVPDCPECGGSSFHRASIFEQPTAAPLAIEPEPESPDWLDGTRSAISKAGRYLAFRDQGRTRLRSLSAGWTRLGRSGAADLRLDDPTVSRRHALIVHQADGALRVLDDRSLNGVFVNGKRVDWSALADGDELRIGRYRLYLIDAS
jgi:FHA domain-containing protein/zinc ribbon family protein